VKASSSSVTGGLLERLLRDQARRAERERRMPFARKLAIVDQLMLEYARVSGAARGRHGEAKVERRRTSKGG
jgi:hypothetical protein